MFLHFSTFLIPFLIIFNQFIYLFCIFHPPFLVCASYSPSLAVNSSLFFLFFFPSPIAVIIPFGALGVTARLMAVGDLHHQQKIV